MSAAATGRRTVSAELSERILRTVRLVGRYVVVVYVFLMVSSNILGRGYLYTLVVQFSWVGAIPIAYVLLRHWRKDIFETYEKVFSGSSFAATVKRLRGEWWAVALLVPAFFHLALHGALVYGRNVAMRFDTTRRALAYVFRRRLERKVAPLSRDRLDAEGVPRPIWDAFSGDSVPEGALVGHFPMLEETYEAMEGWRAGRRGFALALAGERGLGKTTWLRQLASRVGEAAVILRLDETAATEEAVCRVLSTGIGLDEVATVPELVEALGRGPRRVVMIDHAQNLVLRAVGGTDGLEAFCRLVRRTQRSTVWVCSFSRYIWEHIEYVLKDQNVFGRVAILPPWPEKQIAELIERRMEVAGYVARYDDLVTAPKGTAAAEVELERMRERYQRLLWDYADGVARVAMHFWMWSLTESGPGEVRVHLFEAPRPEELERLSEQARFALHAVVSHENLTVEEAAKVLRFPEPQVASLLEMLRAEGYLKMYKGRYRVTMRWSPAVVRHLRRQHLLFT